jgi:16S rRNA (guanine(527)-N(7))-methyltransferase RsmG
MSAHLRGVLKDAFFGTRYEPSIGLLITYYDLLLEESLVQNLSKFLDPESFYYRSIYDCVELLKTDVLRYPVLDIGTGAGVPGLVSAILDQNSKHSWVLTESEGKKASFLLKTVDTLGMQGHVRVVSKRAEKVLLHYPVTSIVSRAVASLLKLYELVRVSSTWKQLILLKTDTWKSEWDLFLKSPYQNELMLLSSYPYRVPGFHKTFFIVHFQRK